MATMESQAEAFLPASTSGTNWKKRGWSEKEFAEILGRRAQAISEIMNGRKQIVPDTALAIGEALGTSADMWLNLQYAYNLYRPVCNGQTRTTSAGGHACDPLCQSLSCAREIGCPTLMTSTSWSRPSKISLGSPTSVKSPTLPLPHVDQTRVRLSSPSRWRGSRGFVALPCITSSTVSIPRSWLRWQRSSCTGSTIRLTWVISRTGSESVG